LFEIGRLTVPADGNVTDLSNRIGIVICDREFNSVASLELTMPWTRDPFDRIIVAQAQLGDHRLITKDQNILQKYTLACW
jgi:PIN domain nuclease of toxin-antitoxin system